MGLLLLSCRHDEKKVSLHIALTHIVNGMDQFPSGSGNKVIFFRGMLPIKVVCRKLDRVACGILVYFTRIRPNLVLDFLGIGRMRWNGTDHDGVVKGDTS